MTELDLTLRNEYETVCLQEELLWLQKSRSTWIKDGDRNTKFYHTQALIRRRRNRILMLQDESGNWESDPAKLLTMVESFFQNLYSHESPPPPLSPLPSRFPKLPASSIALLSTPVTRAEVHSALFDMSPLKSPGVDGLHAMFFQQQWLIVGESLFREVQRVLAGGPLEPQLNRTLIALIPKTTSPQSLKEFRPISLCTTVYKLITKVLANRL